MADTCDKGCQLGASRRRFEDAQALHSCKRWAGSIYLGGYAIECSLKSLICYEEGKNNFKDTRIFKKGDAHRLAEIWNVTDSELARTIKDMVDAGIFTERSRPKDPPPRVYAVTELYLYGLKMVRKEISK